MSSQSNEKIAHHLMDVFGGACSFFGYGDENGESTVDILCSRDGIQKGVNAYATVNLSDHPLRRDGKALDVRAEIICAVGATFKNVDNAVATAAFNVINSGWLVAPGVAHPGVFEMYKISRTMKHGLMVSPFLWEDQLPPMRFPEKTVAFLLMVPISDEELRFLEEHGSERLEELFEKEQIDLFDLSRPSVVDRAPEPRSGGRTAPRRKPRA